MWVPRALFKPAYSPSRELFFRRHHDQGRTQHALSNAVALLQHGDDRVGGLLRRHGADGLVHMRVKFLAHGRCNGDDFIALQRGQQLL